MVPWNKMAGPTSAISAGRTLFAANDGRLSALFARIERSAAVAASMSIVVWMLIQLVSAGPLWRDEICSLNLAQLTSFGDMWRNLIADSCPLVWPSVLRIWSELGLGTDTGVRILGAIIGMGMFWSIWIVCRWLGSATSIIPLVLLGFSPTVLYTATTGRAYGIGILFMVLVLGLVWRAVHSPTRANLTWVLVGSLLLVHSLYSNSVLLFAFLTAGASVRVRRGDWRTALVLIGIGCIAAVSLVPYLRVFQQGGEGVSMMQAPFTSFKWLWFRLVVAIASAGVMHAVAWLILCGFAISLGVLGQYPRDRRDDGALRDRAVYCVISLILGLALYLWFYNRMHIITRSWYYAAPMVLAAVLCESLVFAGRDKLGHSIFRICLAVLLVFAAIPEVWSEIHTRRTNVDLAAKVLNKESKSGDLILVSPFYCGTTFERYYHGDARWSTVPTTNPHLGGGFGDVLAMMTKDDAVQNIRDDIERTLRTNGRVWVVGGIGPAEQATPPSPPPKPPDPVLGWNFQPYERYWIRQIEVELTLRARQYEPIVTSRDVLVNPFENLGLAVFSGYRRVLGRAD